ncbi:hypothetical protein Lal_00016206 [Lupinus albus]|uniref:Putative actin cross-linking n=1 Tax=Lupinus albus TaxID=3870 RepID=A0A6A4QGD1_LUPAL|nr:putative actin cross-linking [Lupinus albus]KAF1873085.1 hypothetical protein Lal_00016206 [Lupinus albus]
MEFFVKAKTIKLHSHLDKYLIADDDRETVRQSRNSSNLRAKWTVEIAEDGVNNNHRVRLKSCHGKYLTATETPFLLGMTGNRVLQTNIEPGLEWKFDWEPVRDGFNVKLRSWSGKYLRANGGTPPWRNSVTHDDPSSSATQDWVLWEVRSVELKEEEEEKEVLLSESVVPSFPYFDSEAVSPMSLFSTESLPSTKRNFKTPGMDFFHHAKTVRLRGHHVKYLIAEEDEESVTQNRNGSSKNARWTLEYVPHNNNIIRLKSCYGKYLTASNYPFLLGMTGHKVLQTLPHIPDSSLEWEPIKDGARVKLRTCDGNFLRANGGLPPWRNTITHDIPHRTATQDWILWDVDVVEINVNSPVHELPSPPPLLKQDSNGFQNSVPSSPLVHDKSPSFFRQQSNDSKVDTLPKMEGRVIYYHVADESGEVSDEGMPMIFKGYGVEELTHKFEEETGLEGIIVCNKSPLNGKLYPLRLQLPPHNVTMHVVLVLPFSKVAMDFEAQGLL